MDRVDTETLRQSERCLIERWKTGDPEAFRGLVDIHGGALFSYLLRMVGNRSDAEDLSQEVFLRVHRARDRFDGMRPFRPWLLTVASNLCKNWFRYRSAHEWNCDPHGAEETAGRGPNARDLVLAEESRRSFHEAFHSMSPEHREVLVLRFQEEYSYEEIAGILGTAVSTVTMRLHRAKKALRHNLKKRRVQPGDSEGLKLHLSGIGVAIS